MLRGLHGCPVLRGRLASGVAEALDAGRGGDKLVGKVVWARREGSKPCSGLWVLQERARGAPEACLSWGGGLVLIRYLGGNVEYGV